MSLASAEMLHHIIPYYDKFFISIIVGSYECKAYYFYT